MKNMLQKKKRVPISSLKTLLSQKLASFLEMKRATRLSRKAVHDTKPVSWIYIIWLWQKNQEKILITPDIFGVKEKSFVGNKEKIRSNIIWHKVTWMMLLYIKYVTKKSSCWRKLSLASKIFNMFTGGGSHARLLRRQGAGL